MLAEGGTYYLYESTPEPDGRGVSVRTSKDLETWSGTSPVLELPPDIASTAVWAPEVHAYDGAYWLFVTLTFAADAAHPIRPMRQEGLEGGTLQPRGVWVFKSGSPLGPFNPVRKGSVPPPGWMCLDGTLWGENGEPWMVFCREWCQTGNGRMMAAPMSRDLSRFTSGPVELFRAADAPGGWRVTDGPFLLRTKDGVLRMIWSNFVKDCGYCILQCASESGSVRGPWKNHMPLYTQNGGHAMLFRRFGDGRLTLALHQPNTPPDERLHLYPVDQTDRGLRIAAAPAAFVDPFVGTAGTGHTFAFVDPFVGMTGTGHTFPGACVPFGLVQASPDIGTGE